MLSLYLIKYIIKNINLICTDFYDYKPSCKDSIKIKLELLSQLVAL